MKEEKKTEKNNKSLTVKKEKTEKTNKFIETIKKLMVLKQFY